MANVGNLVNTENVTPSASDLTTAIRGALLTPGGSSGNPNPDQIATVINDGGKSEKSPLSDEEMKKHVKWLKANWTKINKYLNTSSKAPTLYGPTGKPRLQKVSFCGSKAETTMKINDAGRPRYSCKMKGEEDGKRKRSKSPKSAKGAKKQKTEGKRTRSTTKSPKGKYTGLKREELIKHVPVSELQRFAKANGFPEDQIPKRNKSKFTQKMVTVKQMKEYLNK